ncbi:MAG TPA: family 16 glycoside hydrolase [Candidatus Binatia bacterium]|nr:family 16 glycoside hydrolase [Candidatus Binatia bacterium]
MALVLLAFSLDAAERKFEFGDMNLDQPPPGFRNAVTGAGKPGDWKIILDDVPPLLAPLTPQAPTVTKRAVLAQTAQDPADEHFPLLIYQEETFSDFTLTTRFKTVRGTVEQMAGIAFRVQNETNYYVVRASSLGNTFRFYKVVNGQRGNLIGPEVPIPSGIWHDLMVECKGNQIRCQLDGKEVIPPLIDTSFNSGKIGFWTKSDSVSYFADTKIVYPRRELPAQALVREMAKKYPRLLGLKVYVPGSDVKTTRLIASKDEKEIGQPGAKTEREVIGRGETYFGKDKDSVSVIMPLRDRNGDAIAAARVVMKSFAGQTEENAIVRAAPIVKEMQARVQSLQDLIE